MLRSTLSCHAACSRRSSIHAEVEHPNSVRKSGAGSPRSVVIVISLPKDSALSLLLLCLLVNLANAPGNICFVPCACLLIMAPTPGRKAWFLPRGHALRNCCCHRHRHGHRRHCRARDGPRIRCSSAFLRCLPVGSRGKCDNAVMATDLFRFATSALISHLPRYVHQLLT